MITLYKRAVMVWMELGSEMLWIIPLQDDIFVDLVFWSLLIEFHVKLHSYHDVNSRYARINLPSSFIEELKLPFFTGRISKSRLDSSTSYSNQLSIFKAFKKYQLILFPTTKLILRLKAALES